jgi:dihydropteroate synthase
MTASNSPSTEPDLCLNGFSTRLKPHAIMGILNLTPDSFSDGGKYPSVKSAVAAAEKMIAEGADMLDLGGESTRPGSDPVDVKTELQRVIPVLEALPKNKVLISVDSQKTEVQAAALAAGAHIINDISGGSDTLFRMASQYQAGLILMHTPAEPKIMQSHTHYPDVVETVAEFLATQVERAKAYPIPAIWTDPGIGFGKTLEQNLSLMCNLNRFRIAGCGILLGASRKTWIGHLTGAEVNNRLPGSLVALVAAILKGVEIIRVHDVAASVQARTVATALFGSPIGICGIE